MRLAVLLLAVATTDALLNSLKRLVRRKPQQPQHASAATFGAFKDFLAEQQKVMCNAVEALDGHRPSARTRGPAATAATDSRVIADGALVEKGCISTSYIQGTLTKARAEAMCSRGRENVKAGDRFEAAALSLVLHAKSPHVPTLRGDARCFVVFDENDEPREAWYGGGCDLTPCYVVEDDIRGFHAHWRDVCKGRYQEMKQTCDGYFYLPLRQEHRGVGGVFWDDDASADADALARRVLETMIASWAPIVARRRARRRGGGAAPVATFEAGPLPRVQLAERPRRPLRVESRRHRAHHGLGAAPDSVAVQGRACDWFSRSAARGRPEEAAELGLIYIQVFFFFLA